MHIRPAIPNDAPRISRLIRALAQEFITHEFPEQAANNLLGSMSETLIRGYIEAGYRYHVAEENGELAGVVAVQDNRHIYYLFVSKRFQGQGLARRLWETAKTASLIAGNPGIFTVNSSRYAVGVYERFGFVRQSAEVDCAGVVSIPMQWELASCAT
jgi:ribosomal protein S18 acetylase RimI-like enzyme